MKMLKTAGKGTNRDVLARLQISDRSASRLFAEMTARASFGKRVNARKPIFTRLRWDVLS